MLNDEDVSDPSTQTQKTNCRRVDDNARRGVVQLSDHTEHMKCQLKQIDWTLEINEPIYILLHGSSWRIRQHPAYLIVQGVHFLSFFLLAVLT